MSVADSPESLPLTAPLLVPQSICRDFERASRLEWLETNHTGAFVMGTVAGVNTRRYHALLIASLKPPANRYSILSRVEEVVTLNGDKFPLATAQYPGAVHPHGFELLEEFRLDPFPQWRYACGAGSVTKTICLLDRQQSVLVTYRATQTCSLQVRLFTSFRDYHSLAHQNSALHPELHNDGSCLSFHPYDGLPALSIFHDGAFQPAPEWFLRHQYLRELDRGLDFEEDLFTPGFLQFSLVPETDVWFLATLDPQSFPAAPYPSDIQSILTTERTRRSFHAASPAEALIERALDQFRVTRHDGQPSLLAGYPWFTDWSRDTLISLPALSSAGFPASETKAILQMFLAQRSQGLLPNRFLDSGSEPEYNTADGTLWLFIAARHYLRRTDDLAFLRDVLYPAAQDIIHWHRHGTFYGIHVDPDDGLLWTGEPNSNLTWMDARVNGTSITPRVGKPVEINALWYNALRITAAWSRSLKREDEAQSLDSEADRTLSSFRAAFWNDRRKCLFDVVSGSAPDPTLRPNQIFALSLPYPLIAPEQARQTLELVKDKLLTPFGLRTLEPGDPAYRPRFEGSMAQRDSAYHQGTVWPWLLGPFVEAFLYAFEETDQSLAFCRILIHNLQQQLTACCLGSLAEVYDAEPPYRPAGCPAQLWSVAQLALSLRRLAALSSSQPA